jgi:hypothetical protein
VNGYLRSGRLKRVRGLVSTLCRTFIIRAVIKLLPSPVSWTHCATGPSGRDGQRWDAHPNQFVMFIPALVDQPGSNWALVD